MNIKGETFAERQGRSVLATSDSLSLVAASGSVASPGCEGRPGLHKVLVMHSFSSDTNAQQVQIRDICRSGLWDLCQLPGREGQAAQMQRP